MKIPRFRKQPKVLITYDAFRLIDEIKNLREENELICRRLDNHSQKITDISRWERENRRLVEHTQQFGDIIDNSLSYRTHEDNKQIFSFLVISYDYVGAGGKGTVKENLTVKGNELVEGKRP